jgi:hypothetical protein
MAIGFIDSATVYDIASVTRKDNPSDSCTWAWQSALTTTSALINLQNLKIAPSPSQAGAASDVYCYITKSLSGMVGIIQTNEKCNIEAIAETKQFVTQNTDKIRQAFNDVKNCQSFEQWLNEGIRYSWIEHSSRLHGLFNFEFIPQLSLITNISEFELKRAWNLSCNTNYLHEIASGKTDNDNLMILKDSYMLSALLRGYFHDVYAKSTDLQIIHHPFRKPILPILGTEKIEFNVSNTEKYLSTIVLAGAMSQNSQINRIGTWVDNIEKARRALSAETIDLRNKHFDSVALNIAVDTAKKIDIITSSKYIDKLLEVFISFGINLTSSFVLQGWESFALGTASYIAMDHFRLGKSINKLISNRDTRLKALANTNAGRIEQVWDDYY